MTCCPCAKRLCRPPLTLSPSMLLLYFVRSIARKYAVIFKGLLFVLSVNSILLLTDVSWQLNQLKATGRDLEGNNFYYIFQFVSKKVKLDPINTTFLSWSDEGVAAAPSAPLNTCLCLPLLIPFILQFSLCHIFLIPDPISFNSYASFLIYSPHNPTYFHYMYPPSHHPYHVLPFSHSTPPSLSLLIPHPSFIPLTNCSS